MDRSTLPSLRACYCYALICLTFGPILVANTLAEDKVTLRVTVTGQDLEAVRVSLVGTDKKAHTPTGAVLRTTKKKMPYFYSTPDFKVALPPGRYTLSVASGIEFAPRSEEVVVRGDMTHRVQLNRWADLASQHWYAGDSHVHLHTGGPIKVTTKDALLAAKAEGIHYANLCVSNNVGDDIRDADLITGVPHSDSNSKHLLVFGEEMRSMIYGHMQFFGIKKFVEPQYTGFKDTPNSNDYPANFVMAKNATEQGGVVTYGHPMFKGQPIPYGDDLTANNAAARELPIDAILGVVQAVDLMCYNSDEELSTELWYKLLNCGLRLAACVGTDALLDQSTDPMGGSRVYVYSPTGLTNKGWLDGLRNGRTFVTNGPIPLLTLNGKSPGEVFKTRPDDKHTFRIRVTSHVPFQQVELIVNGKAQDTAKFEDAVEAEYDVQLPITRSSWVALRVTGKDHDDIFDGPAFAHTSPIYLLVGGKEIASKKDAAYFVEWIDQLLRVVKVRNGYKTAADREKVEAIFRRARAKFEEMTR